MNGQPAWRILLHMSLAGSAVARLVVALGAGGFVVWSAGAACGRLADSPPAHLQPSPQAPAALSAPPPAARRIRFSGYDWWVKSSQSPVGPGPNVFHEDNVDVDADERLRLRIAYRNGRWTCAEIVLLETLGYGTYRFHLEDTSNLDPRAVLGLFTWDPEAADHFYREIDIEIGRWGDPEAANAQFVVQPYTRSGRVHRFDFPRGRASHAFSWTPGNVSFASRLAGTAPADAEGPLVSSYAVSEGVPPAGSESARINLWLLAGQPPAGDAGVEVIVTRFDFVPSPSGG